MAKKGGAPAKRRRDPEAKVESQRRWLQEKRRRRAAERELREEALQEALGAPPAGEEPSGR